MLLCATRTSFCGVSHKTEILVLPEANASPRPGPWASAERFYKITWHPFLVVRRCTSGVRKCFFLRGEKRFEAILIDRFHEGFMRLDNALFEQCPNCVVHELHTLSLSGNDHILKLLRRSFTNDGRDGSVRDQNFVYGDAAR